MERTTETLQKPADHFYWRVRLTVLWRDDSMPVPIQTESRNVAANYGVQLIPRPGSCVAYFSVSAMNPRRAVSGALDYWEAVVSEADLPKWEVVSLSIDQTEDLELDLHF